MLNLKMAEEVIEPLPDSEKKSTIVAALLYFFSYWTGLHHFYLGRDFHAFLVGSTFGGFGFGAFADFFHIQEYVNEANEESLTVALYETERKARKKPRIGIERVFYQLVAASLYHAVFTYAIPTGVPFYTLIVLIVGPFAIAVAVWIAGNYGRQKVGFRYPLIAAAFVYAALHFFPTEEMSGSFSAIIVATIVAQYNREFRRLDEFPARRRRRLGLCKRVVILSLGALILTSGWTAFILFNAEITDEHGQTMKLSEAISNFFRSPAWAQFGETLGKAWEELGAADSEEEEEASWENFFNRLKNLMDLDGETRSLTVLGLSEDATDAQIKKAYRSLARKWHPDHNQGNADQAAKKFMEIQEAYETLVKLRSLRKKKTSESTAESPSNFHAHNDEL